MRKTVLLRPAAKTLNQSADNYKTHLQTLGHSIKGSNIKYRHLLEFFGWLELQACLTDSQGIAELEKITPQQIQSHYQYLTERPNHNQGPPKRRAGSTISLKSAFSHMRAIQLFFDQLHAQGIIKSNPASVLKFSYPKSSSTRRALTQQQIKQLYAAAINHQERAMLSLAYGCGLRASELEKLNLQDINFNERIVIVRHGKGNKSRTIPIHYKVATDLQNYLDYERAVVKSSAFMLHAKDERMKYYTWNKYLKRIALRAEIEDTTTHVLRHSIATHLIEKSVEVQQVRIFLGHTQLETTQIYTHVRYQQLQQLL